MTWLRMSGLFCNGWRPELRSLSSATHNQWPSCVQRNRCAVRSPSAWHCYPPSPRRLSILTSQKMLKPQSPPIESRWSRQIGADARFDSCGGSAERQGKNARQLLESVALETGDDEIAVSVVTVVELAHGITRADTTERRDRR